MRMWIDMKILNINNFYYNRGGVTKYYLSLEKILLGHGHSVIPFSTKNEYNIPSDYKEYFVDGYTSNSFNSLSVFKKGKSIINGIYSLEARRNIEKLIIETKPEIAHIHNIFYQISPSILHSLIKFRIPIVYSLHDYNIFCANAVLYSNGAVCEKCLKNSFINVIKNRCFKNSILMSIYAVITNRIHRYLNIFKKNIDLFVVPTDIMKQKVIEWGLRKEKIRVISNPFLFDDIFPSFYQGDYILFYGSMVKCKGIFTLLKAMKRIRNIKLLIVGKDVALEEKSVIDYIESNKLDNVELNTKIRWGSKLKKIIDKSMFVVNPSEWLTPMDYTVYEAMAFGKPVVVSDMGGNKKLVKDHWNGVIFKAGDSNDLANKMLSLINNKKVLKRYGFNGRKLIEEKYNTETYYLKIIAVYEELLNSKGSKK